MIPDEDHEQLGNDEDEEEADKGVAHLETNKAARVGQVVPELLATGNGATAGDKRVITLAQIAHVDAVSAEGEQSLEEDNEEGQRRRKHGRPHDQRLDLVRHVGTQVGRCQHDRLKVQEDGDFVRDLNFPC